MCPSLIEIGSKTAEKNSAQTDRQTNRHYKNNGHLAVNEKKELLSYTEQHVLQDCCDTRTVSLLVCFSKFSNMVL